MDIALTQAEEQWKGNVLMRPLTSAILQLLMADAFFKIDFDSRVRVGGGRLLLNSVLSDPYVDVALVGMRGPRPRGTRFMELNNEISDDVASRIDASCNDGCTAHLGAARAVCSLRTR
jgi:hypothetical protein